MKKLHDLRHHPFVVRLEGSVLGRLATAMLAANMRDRALSIAGQAFIALVPLPVVMATIASASKGQAVADWLIGRFELEAVG